MTRKWRDSDIPRMKTDVQWAPLPARHLLIRSDRGIGLLGGVDEAPLRRLLDAVDGRRDLGQIRETLEADLGESAFTRLLDGIWGELLEAVSDARARPTQERGPQREAPSNPGGEAEVLVMGSGMLAETIAAAMRQYGVACRLEREWESSSDLRLGGSIRLLLAAPERMDYRRLAALQHTCLKGGVAALFLTLDADGLRVGPSVLPGETPCWFCHQITNFRALRLPAKLLSESIGNLVTGRSPEPRVRDSVVERVVSEAAALLGRSGRPQLLFAAEIYAPQGVRRYSVQRNPDCPHCSGPGVEARRSCLEAAIRQAQREWMDAWERRPSISFSEDRSPAVRTVGILGGGTAGYLSALALRKKNPNLEISLIESSRLPIIGVGEATTPLMPQFLHLDLGLDIHELFERVRPTFKLGIRFTWGPGPEAVFNYPFGRVHVLEPWRFDGHVGRCSRRSMMMTAGKLPLESGGSDGPGLGVETAYHLENRRFVAYLQKKAAERGVRRIDTVISEIRKSPDDEQIANLIAEDGRKLAFDLYLDCSGFESLLMGKALGSAFVAFRSSLLTDRALIAAAPHGGVIQPYTHAEAMDAGWCWNTPQVEEDHRGYVYCSRFLDEDAAEAEMRRKIPGLGSVRGLRFRPGRRAHFWKGNVVALGNAYGFVEPLESTALHMLIRQIGLLSGALASGGARPATRALLNRKVNGWWDYLRWFLAIHYKFNTFQDTPFWRACRAEADVSAFQELIDAFVQEGPLSCNRALRSAFDYPDPLWGAEGIDILLLGQRLPCPEPRTHTAEDTWQRWTKLAESQVQRAPDQARALALMRERPELLQAFLESFQRVGPAFGGP